MNIFYPPEKFVFKNKTSPTIFLGGSIEMGKAIDWQSKVANDLEQFNVTLLNPRRKDWDSSWKQDPDFAPFKEQVTWELNAIKMCDIVIINFCSGTMSPISLLELGIVLSSAGALYRPFVCCPKDFYRYGNVKITCDMYNVKVYDNLDDLISELKTYLHEDYAI